MPKEMAHWHIAGDVIRLGVPEPISKIITRYPELYYLGAIVHDISFYDLSNPEEGRIEWVGNQLHGVDGENTLLPLGRMIEQALRQPDREPHLSFVLGMLSHFAADSTFHPLVYYLSGNYFDEDEEKRAKAVFRHRLIETSIDLWLETQKHLEYPEYLNGLWRDSGKDGREVFASFMSQYAVDRDKTIRTRFRSAWRWHRILQAAFKSVIPWKLLCIYRRLGHPNIEKHEALFYPQPIELSFLERPIEWRHPVTGENYLTGLAEVYASSVERCRKIMIELAVGDPEDWPGILRKMEPLSLDTGLAYVPVSEMKYFFAEPIERWLRPEKS